MYEKRCPHPECRGLCWGRELRRADGSICAIEYTCQHCGMTWTEYV